MGGDYGATTLPNMISRFTGSTPYGVSLGEHPSVISWGPINMGHHYNGQDGFNAGNFIFYLIVCNHCFFFLENALIVGIQLCVSYYNLFNNFVISGL